MAGHYGKPWRRFGQPNIGVLLQGRNLRGSLPFLQRRLVPQFVPAKFVRGQLQRLQATACFNNGGRPDIRVSGIIIGLMVAMCRRSCLLRTGLLCYSVGRRASVS